MQFEAGSAERLVRGALLPPGKQNQLQPTEEREAQTGEGICPESHPDPTESPSWALTPVPAAPQGGKGPHREDLGDEPVAKATPGARVAVGKTLSPGNTVSWTHLTGKRSEAGQHPTCRPVPGAPGGWEPRPLL